MLERLLDADRRQPVAVAQGVETLMELQAGVVLSTEEAALEAAAVLGETAWNGPQKAQAGAAVLVMAARSIDVAATAVYMVAVAVRVESLHSLGEQGGRELLLSLTIPDAGLNCFKIFCADTGTASRLKERWLINRETNHP